MKKLVLFLIVMILPLSVFSAEFTDITAYDWAQEAISELAEKGIINGMSEGIFYPEGNVTYEQLAKMTVLAFGSDINLPDTPTFDDVAEDRWSYEYVEKAKKWFDINGTSFNPAENAPRWEVAGAVVRALGLKAENPAVFSDSDDMTEEMQEIAAAAQEHGIMTGYPDGTFAPMKEVSRAETAVILHRAMSLEPEKEEITEPEETPVPDDVPESEESPEVTPEPEEEEPDVRMDFFVISKATDVLSDSGEATVKLTGYNNSEEVEFTCERAHLYNAEGVRDDTITFAPGDVAMAVRDITTGVRWIIKYFDASDMYNNGIIENPNPSVNIGAKGYLDYNFGLVRKVSTKALTLVTNDTVTTQNSINSLMCGLGDEVNYYEYDPDKKKITLAEKGDITADKEPSSSVATEDGSFVFAMRRDNVVTDVLIMYNK